MITTYNFKTRGIGLITTEPITKDFYIGDYLNKKTPPTPSSRIIFDGWVETNPFGRYLNHNKNSNLYFKKNKEAIELYTKSNIPNNTELTVNYLELIHLIKIPNDLVVKYGILDFEYLEENIFLTKTLL